MWKAVLVYTQESLCLLPLKNIFQKKDFSEIEQWRSRVPVDDVLSDVYVGSVWKELSAPCQFLSVPYSHSLHLNIDWFKIYKHVNYLCT